MHASATRLALGILCGLVPATAAFAQAPSGPKQVVERVYYDAVLPGGALAGGRAEVLVPDRSEPVQVRLAAVSTLTQHFGPPPDPANRVDVVYVGDGYTAAELGDYANDVAAIQPTFFAKEPYRTYQSYFTVHRVDVVSNESGVDNDPVQGIQRDTALDMEYWCGGTDRLLCVDVGAASAYAHNAPGVDLICALANSSTYGGAGYPDSDLATSAATNGAAIEIVLHEFGHALGDLADEYDYGGSATYHGGEPSEPNVSILTSAPMAAQTRKWYRWLGVNNPLFDGTVSTFEGGMYHQFGIYRPTNNSLMRNLGRPYNLPSIEQIVIAIYEDVRPIDDSSSTQVIYGGTETLFVTPMTPLGHALGIQWAIDGVPIPGANGTTLDLASLGLTTCDREITVTVTDDTIFVRNPVAQADLLTETRTFELLVDGGPFVNYCVVSPNSVGSGAVMGFDGSSSVAANDLVLYSGVVPPGAIGIFFYGGSANQVPFGNGFLCVGAPVARLGVAFADLIGFASKTLDLTNLPPNGPIGTYDVRRFQHWYRNPAGGGAGFNLSDGLRVQFCP